MEAIVCKNDTKILIDKLQEYLNKGGIIRNAFLVDSTPHQVVVLISQEEISQHDVEMFWIGFKSALS